jgi:hypothetical protein
LKMWRNLPRQWSIAIMGTVGALLLVAAVVMIALSATPKSDAAGLSTNGLVLHATCDPRVVPDDPGGNLAATESFIPGQKHNWALQYVEDGRRVQVNAASVTATYDAGTQFLHIQWSTILPGVSWVVVLVDYTDGTTSYIWVRPNTTSKAVFLQKDQIVSQVSVAGNSPTLPPAHCSAQQGASGPAASRPGATRPLSPIFTALAFYSQSGGKVWGKFVEAVWEARAF